MSTEKQPAFAKANSNELPLPTSTNTRSSWTLWQKMRVVGAFAAIGFLVGKSCCSSTQNNFGLDDWLRLAKEDKTDWVSCPHQPAALHPMIKWEVDAQYRNHSADSLSAAIQIPTQSYDDNGEPKEDPRWKPFFEFQQWLVKSFPEVHSAAKVEYINTLGILLTLEGTDSSLKPLLLMSHYDVVPAPDNSLDRWTHGPFSGYNDGTFIWGRGSTDVKTLLVAQYEALTLLLKAGFQPRRTVIFSHGFDEEEVFARQGAGHIAPFLEERYGKDSILLIIDEGSGISDDVYGAPFALPVSGEKGYLDIAVTVGTPGGHSSIPPPHTGIGIMSEVIIALEANPFPTVLTSASPYLTHLQCAAQYSPSFPSRMLKMLKREGPYSWPHLAAEIGAISHPDRAVVSTTTAVDVINGGVKVNALPEQVVAKVNFRIDFASNVKATEAHIAKIVKKVAKEFDLAFEAFARNSTKELGHRFVTVERFGLPLEPAPRSPQEGGVWDLFAGTIKAALPGPHGQDRIVSPYAATGNTDCKVYYNLSKHVYRFIGLPEDSAFGMHTVNERSTIDGHVGIVRWIHAIIQNTDAYTGPE